MFINVSKDSVVTLEDAENFKAFKVVSALDGERLGAALAGAGRVEGAHAWIDPAWLTAQVPKDAGWCDGFAKMTGYAAKSGWVDEGGAIRAHIETSGQ